MKLELTLYQKTDSSMKKLYRLTKYCSRRSAYDRIDQLIQMAEEYAGRHNLIIRENKRRESSESIEIDAVVA
ncbi:MAG: hypothetical protein LBU32_19855 [Clostridiales bacterium]|jgi:hypothetical protein|nr:hypothetical protein [Clostridiales bacterium]